MAVLNTPQNPKQAARPIILTAAMRLTVAIIVAGTKEPGMEEPGTMVAARTEVQAAMAVEMGAEATVVAEMAAAVVAVVAVAAGVVAVAAESD